MDEEAYRKLVIKLRDHQDAWFRRHTPSDLHEARRLEKVLDAENRRWLDEKKNVRPTDTPKQTTLFE